MHLMGLGLELLSFRVGDLEGETLSALSLTSAESTQCRSKAFALIRVAL